MLPLLSIPIRVHTASYFHSDIGERGYSPAAVVAAAVAIAVVVVVVASNCFRCHTKIL